MADEAIVRFCTQKYEKAGTSNFKKIMMHLTNYSINKGSKDFVDDVMVEDVLKPNNATKRTLTALFAEIDQSTNDPSIAKKI